MRRLEESFQSVVQEARSGKGLRISSIRVLVLRVDWREKAGNIKLSGRVEGAAGDDVMNMGMILEGSSPGVKDAEESREISADVVLIWSEFLDGVGRGFEQGRISHPLVFTDEAA